MLLAAFLALKDVSILDVTSLDEIILMAFVSVAYESSMELD